MTRIKTKIFVFFVLTAINFVSGVPQHPVGIAKSSQKAFEFVTRAEKELHEAAKKYTVIEWAYATNITDYNEKKRLEFQVINQFYITKEVKIL